MLNRDSELASPEKIISDNLTHKPSVGQSVWNNYSLGQATAPHAIASFNEQYNTSPTGKAMQINFENLRRGNENQEVGWGQWGVNEVSNMLGQTLSPFTWMFGEVGLLATKPFTAAASAIIPASSLLRQPISKLMNESAAKYIPELAGKGEQAQTLSMALLGKSYTEAFGVGAGVTLPQATIDNFNAETGKHDFLGIAKETAAGGTLGLALNTIPFAWGIVKHNILRRTGIDIGTSPTPAGTGEVGTPLPHEEDLRQAVKDGKLSQESFDNWMELHEIDKQVLLTKSTKFVASQGHEVDYANNTANFEILNRDQINNLQSTTLDYLVSDHIPKNQRSALTDFTVQAGIDEMRNNPNLLDGVRGYVDYATDRLARKDEVLAKADAIVDDHFKLNTFYRGYPGEKHGFTPIKSTEQELQQHDFQLGKGYWYAETEAHAKAYGADVEVAGGHYKIFDVNKNNDIELNKKFKAIEDEYKFQYENRSKKHTNQIDSNDKLLELIKSFRDSVRKKGYEGIRRLETEVDSYGVRTGGGRKPEIMFFEKPKSFEENTFPLSQQHLLEAVKKSKELPVTIPDNVAEHARQEARIAELEKRNEKLFSHYEKTGESHFTDKMRVNNDEIESIKSSLVEMKSPIQELTYIKNKLLDAQVKGERYYRGYNVSPFRRAQYDPFPDIEFGEGYWFTKSKEHAIFYGKNIDQIEGQFHIFNVDKSNDNNLKDLYKKVKNTYKEFDRLRDPITEQGYKLADKLIEYNEKLNAAIKSHEKSRDKFIKAVKNAGYQGLERKEGFLDEYGQRTTSKGQRPIRKDEVMFFDKPKFKERKLIDKNSKEYHRLLDLSEIWHPAKTLLDRVNLEDNIQKQENYRNLAKQMLDIADNNIGKQADIEKVKGYLEARTKQRIDETKAESMIEVNEANKVPADSDTIIAETDRRMDSLTHEHAKEEYTLAKEKYGEFKNSEGIFKSMINCILGAKE